MKRRLLLLFILISCAAYSQITLQHSDYQSAFSEGSVYLTYSTPIGGPEIEVFVGQASQTAQIWDFTPYSMDYVAVSNSIEPSTAPFFSDFPSSSMVLYEKYWMAEGDTLYSWNYKDLASDELLLLGVSDENSILLTWDPPAVQAIFPMTLGTTWMRERDSTEIMPGFYIITEGIVTIDAFGTIRVPSGEFPCLRMRNDNRTISHTPVGDDTTSTRSFNFYTQDMIEVNLPAIHEDQFDLEAIMVSGVKLSGRQGSVGLPSIKPPFAGELLTGIYPNPASHLAEIGYTLKNNAIVNILVTDLSGRVIAEIYNDYQTIGEHRASFDVSVVPDGLYFCRIQSNGVSETKKIVVSR